MSWNYLIKTIAQRTLTLLSPTLNTRFNYRLAFHKRLNLKCPTTFNEKICWLKLYRYNHDPLVAQCANKYFVRDYVKLCGCEEILNPLYGVYNRFEEINWDNLPDKFVIKSSYGAGKIMLVEDKHILDKKKVKHEIRRWQHSTLHLEFAELQYKTERKILIEHFIESATGHRPEDYKIYCFHGKATYCMVCEGRGEHEHPRFYYFDKEGNLCRQMSADSMSAPADYVYRKPESWDEMYRYAGILSKPFPFVRCDFYLSNGKVYFGELTFTPAAGIDNDKLPSTDNLLGSLLTLPTSAN